MPTLTRRRGDNPHQETWHVHFEGVQIGTIAERAGVPKDVEQWGWDCGFSPASDRGIRTNGIAETFDDARADFERAWRTALPKCTDADFVEHHYQRAATAWKYAMWEAGCKMPTQTLSGTTKCFCGAIINTKTSGDHIRARHMEAA